MNNNSDTQPPPSWETSLVFMGEDLMNYVQRKKEVKADLGRSELLEILCRKEHKIGPELYFSDDEETRSRLFSDIKKVLNMQGANVFQEWDKKKKMLRVRCSHYRPPSRCKFQFALYWNEKESYWYIKRGPGVRFHTCSRQHIFVPDHHTKNFEHAGQQLLYERRQREQHQLKQQRRQQDHEQKQQEQHDMENQELRHRQQFQQSARSGTQQVVGQKRKCVPESPVSRSVEESPDSLPQFFAVSEEQATKDAARQYQREDRKEDKFYESIDQQPPPKPPPVPQKISSTELPARPPFYESPHRTVFRKKADASMAMAMRYDRDSERQASARTPTHRPRQISGLVKDMLQRHFAARKNALASGPAGLRSWPDICVKTPDKGPKGALEMSGTAHQRRKNFDDEFGGFSCHSRGDVIDGLSSVFSSSLLISPRFMFDNVLSEYKSKLGGFKTNVPSEVLSLVADDTAMSCVTYKSRAGPDSGLSFCTNNETNYVPSLDGNALSSVFSRSLMISPRRLYDNVLSEYKSKISGEEEEQKMPSSPNKVPKELSCRYQDFEFDNLSRISWEAPTRNPSPVKVPREVVSRGIENYDFDSMSRLSVEAPQAPPRRMMAGFDFDSMSNLGTGTGNLQRRIHHLQQQSNSLPAAAAAAAVARAKLQQHRAPSFCAVLEDLSDGGSLLSEIDFD